MRQPIKESSGSPGRDKVVRTFFLVSLIAFLLTMYCWLTEFRPPAMLCDQKNGTPAALSQENTEIHLTQGSIIKSQVSNGELDSYRIILSTGQFLRIVANKCESELTLALFDPDGKKVIEKYSRQHLPTPLSCIAKTSGAYRLEVCLSGSQTDPIYYELIIKEVRSAMREDRSILSAENSISEAIKLRRLWKSESILKAIDKYKEALFYYHAAGDLAEEANTLKLIGEAYSTLSENRKALDYYNRAYKINQAIGDKPGEIESLNSIGLLCVDLGLTRKTLEYCARALALSRKMGDSRGEAQALNNLGLGHFATGDMQKASDLFNQSLLLWKNANGRGGQAEALNNKGYSFHAQGDLRKALECYNQALLIWRAIGNLRGQAYALTAMGGVYSSLGEKQKALDLHAEAIQLFGTIGDRNGEAAALNGIGYAYEDLGSEQKALDAYIKALGLYRDTGNRNYECLTTGYIGRIYYALGQNQRARSYYKQKLLLSRTIGDLQMQANTLRLIGAIVEILGNRSEALSYYKRALSLSVAVNDRRLHASTLNSIGHLYEAAGAIQKALVFYNEALPIIRAAEDRRELTLTLHNLARVENRLGKTSEAVKRMEEVLSIVESLRTKIISHELRASYFASVQQHYQLYMRLLMKIDKSQPGTGLRASAFEASERARARTMLESLSEAHVDIRQGVPPDLLENEQTLLQQLNVREERLSSLLSGRPDAEQVAAAKNDLQELLSQYENLQAQIKSQSSLYALVTRPQPSSLAEIQQVLDSDTILLEYSLGDEQSYLWAVTQSSLSVFELPGRAVIESLAYRVLELLIAYPQAEEGKKSRSQLAGRKVEWLYRLETAKLSKMLLGPLSSRMKNKRLLIVPDGLLMYVPFAALPEMRLKESAADPAESGSPDLLPLVYNHEIAYLPSASTLVVLRRQITARKPAPRAVAIFADPVFENDDSRLLLSGKRSTPRLKKNAAMRPQRAFQEKSLGAVSSSLPRLLSTQHEADAILSCLPDGAGLIATGFKATRANAIGDEIGNYRIIHFATHGLIDTERPELSAIVLSLIDENGRPQNGFLRIHDIYNLNLSADLVVLSACNTALGKNIKGEGIVGMTRAFMYAGAARVVSTLWKVDDDATAKLMKRFYESMLKKSMTPSASLRAAQIEMWKQKRWRNPYYWAAFALQGEWK